MINHVHRLKMKALHGDTLLSDDVNWYTVKMESAMKKAGGDPDGVFIMFFDEHLLICYHRSPWGNNQSHVLYKLKVTYMSLAYCM